MRSTRLPQSLATTPFANAVAGLRARGAALLDLTETNPTRVGLDYPVDLLDGLADPAALHYDPHPLGLLSAREQVAQVLFERGVHADPGHIVLTASTSEAYSFLFKLWCAPGDAVLVPRPSYPLFEHLTRLEGVRPLPYDLAYHGTWRIDVDRLELALDETVRAVLVVSPNNPTGSWLHRSERNALGKLLRDRQLPLIGDEVFAEYPLECDDKAVAVAGVEDVLTASLGGLSKLVGLPQIKVGWIALDGPSDTVTNALDGLELIADTYLSVSTPAQHALPALLERGRAVREAIAARLRRNLAALRAAVAAVPAVSVPRVEGGWSAVLRVPAIEPEEVLVYRLLEQQQLLVQPGYFYDFPHEAFLVVSLLPAPAVFDQGVTRLFEGLVAGLPA